MAPLSIRFRVHSVAVEVRAREPAAFAEPFDFFTGRVAEEAREQASVILEEVPSGLTRLHVNRGPHAVYGKLEAADAAALRLGQNFLIEEVGNLLEWEGLHRISAFSFLLPNGQAVLTSLAPALLSRERLESAGCQLLSGSHSLVTRRGEVVPYPIGLRFKAGLAPRAEQPHAAGYFVHAEDGIASVPSFAERRSWQEAPHLLRALVWAEKNSQAKHHSRWSSAQLAASRLSAASALLARAQVCLFLPSANPEQNTRELLASLAGEKRSQLPQIPS